MSPPPKTLVLGAGELGLSVLSALATHPARDGTSITVLLRSVKPSLQAQLDTWGVTTVYADIASSSISELADVLKEYDTVVGCMGMYLPAGSQLKIATAVLQAGKEGKVRRYLPWQYGVDYDAIGRGSGQDLFDEQLEVRELLRGQKEVKWCIVSTGMFMSFLFEEAFGVVVGLKGGGDLKVRALGGRENKVTVTTVEDIGRVVAEVVWGAPETEGVVFTAGQTVGYAQLAEILEDLLGRKVEMEDRGVEQLKKELEEKPDDGLRKYRLVFAAGKGVWWDEGDTFDKQRGMELQGIKEWCEQSMNGT